MRYAVFAVASSARRSRASYRALCRARTTRTAAFFARLVYHRFRAAMRTRFTAAFAFCRFAAKGIVSDCWASHRALSDKSDAGRVRAKHGSRASFIKDGWWRFHQDVVHRQARHRK